MSSCSNSIENYFICPRKNKKEYVKIKRMNVQIKF